MRPRTLTGVWGVFVSWVATVGRSPLVPPMSGDVKPAPECLLPTVGIKLLPVIDSRQLATRFRRAKGCALSNDIPDGLSNKVRLVALNVMATLFCPSKLPIFRAAN
jgi:hypothetical protein